MTHPKDMTDAEALAVLDASIAYMKSHGWETGPEEQARARLAAVVADAAELLDAADYALLTLDDAGNLSDTAKFNLITAIAAMRGTTA